MQYLVEVIREQQLLEWKGESSEQSDCKCVYNVVGEGWREERGRMERREGEDGEKRGEGWREERGRMERTAGGGWREERGKDVFSQ